jgi:hypothetical protein
MWEVGGRRAINVEWDLIRSKREDRQDIDITGEETITSHHISSHHVTSHRIATLSPARVRLKSASPMGLGRAASAPLERNTCTPA